MEEEIVSPITVPMEEEIVSPITVPLEEEISVPSPKVHIVDDKEELEIHVPQRRSERALHWGGVLSLPDRTIPIYNTCTVDNLLVFFNYLLDIGHIQDWFYQYKDIISVCDTLLGVKSLFQAGNWSDGRSFWISEMCPPPSTNGKAWNMYGSESQRFVQFLSFQASLVRCNARVLESTEILLGDIGGSRQTFTLQESISQWDGTGKILGGLCSTTPREFKYMAPPVIVLSVSYLSVARGFKAHMIPEVVIVMGMKYTVFGYTVNTGEHFRSYFKRSSIWWMYDGLLNPEITEVGSKGADGVLEHVVFVKC